ncbi:RNAse P Rpr2/Rpp21/SNM1 subunit domain-containing protein [Armillaria luteobubalina]|uniref:RNAse P Rpr2/Rpp21/SNM1 subunit domain-containing protein n=1 Tax=Armillaria luteobubalina TaxID=153913 RepID=A0AA39PKE7_9AGAR|nr:RNAse P Rpr2/Rpp21/SNM1 subunit domain-containing protein [Armillaria luteobubalina]
MARKAKDDTPNVNSVPNKDIIQRLNYLYQASMSLNGVTSQSSPRRKRVTTSDSRSYVSSMKVVGQKTVVKMDPSVKRTICKGCNTILVPGSTVTIRANKSASHGHVMAYTCAHCKTTRRIPASPAEKGPKPRSPPLFARNHVVFSGGQEQVEPDGTFIV